MFDAVGVEEIEAAAGGVVGVGEGGEADRLHPVFGAVEIVDLQPDMVERLALRVTPVGMLDLWAGVESLVGATAADAEGRTALPGGAGQALARKDVGQATSGEGRGDGGGRRRLEET